MVGHGPIFKGSWRLQAGTSLSLPDPGLFLSGAAWFGSESFDFLPRFP